MKVREMIQTFYPAHVWYGHYPATQCAAFNKADQPWGILGNFGHAQVVIDGVCFQNTEQLFHLMKFRHPEAIIDIYSAKGLTLKHKAKKWEKNYCREDWPSMIVDALKYCLAQKYQQSEPFRKELERSGGLYIVEDETNRRSSTYGMQLIGDEYVGANLMGRLLMELRDKKGALEYTLPEDALGFIAALKNKS